MKEDVCLMNDDLQQPIRTTVRNFIVDNFLFGAAEGLTDQISFLDEGIIDSTGVLELVEFLEKTFHFTVEDEELIPDNLDSIDNIEAFVQKKTTG
jgi:acyl carrier protein